MLHYKPIVTVILGGGQGSRLFPLTKDRSKPAVPLAGKYRLIDIPISNCINSGMRLIYVLTMFQSASLNSHIANAYRFDHFSRSFIEILAAEQTRKGGTWYHGTADAVRQAWQHITDIPAANILILSGDHLYRMNYLDFFTVHTDSKGDVSIAVQPVKRKEATQLGLLKIDDSGRIVKFMEKPSREEDLDAMMVDTTILGLSQEDANERPFLASMGIYLFQTKILQKLLAQDPNQTDFGKHIIPAAIEQLHVQAFCFNGYWADIGTVSAFYDANMDLVQPHPKFNLYDALMPLYTNVRYLPGARINQASVENAVLCDGVIVEGAMVRDSLLGVRTRIQPGATIKKSIIMGADFYQNCDNEVQSGVGIGQGAYLRKVIVDKNASIGAGVQLINRNKIEYYDDPEERLYVREGIIIIPKNAVIPDGFVF